MDVRLNKNDPDFEIELFWYGFKQAMINFYKSVDKPYRQIDDWSSILNKLKLEKNYNEIESKIRDYITMYSFHLLKYSTCTYHDELLITNIKRWNRISEKFNFIQSSAHHSSILTLFKIFLELKKLNRQDVLSTLPLVEKILEDTKYYDPIICYALDNDKPKLLELLKEIPNYNVIDRITFLIPTLKFYKTTHSVKICNEYKNIKCKIDIKSDTEIQIK